MTFSGAIMPNVLQTVTVAFLEGCEPTEVWRRCYLEEMCQLSTIVLDSGRSRRTRVRTSHELRGKRGSLLIDSTMQIYEINWLLLQRINSVTSSFYLKEWCHLTTCNHAEASKRWVAKYYVALWSGRWYLILVHWWRSWAVRPVWGGALLGNCTTTPNSVVYITVAWFPTYITLGMISGLRRKASL